MKNLKLIIAACAISVSATNLVYPIIFTGPGRRQAHRHEAEASYEKGVAEGSMQKESGDEFGQNDDLQARNMNNSENYGGDDSSIDENYADDGSVVIQSQGQLSQIIQNLSPEEKSAIREKLQHGVTTQAIIDEDSNDEQAGDVNAEPSDVAGNAQGETIAIPEEQPTLFSAEQEQVAPQAEQAMTTQILDDQSAAEPANTLDETALFDTENSSSVAEEDSTPLAQHNFSDNDDALVNKDTLADTVSAATPDIPVEEIKSNSITDEQPAAAEEIAPVVIEQPTPAAIEEVAPVEVEESVAIAPSNDEAAPAVRPLPAQQQKVAERTVMTAEKSSEIEPACPEQVKVIKVYPAYEAACEIWQHVKQAGLDMFNYVHGLVNRKSASEVTTQCKN